MTFSRLMGFDQAQRLTTSSAPHARSEHPVVTTSLATRTLSSREWTITLVRVTRRMHEWIVFSPSRSSRSTSKTSSGCAAHRRQHGRLGLGLGRLDSPTLSRILSHWRWR